MVVLNICFGHFHPLKLKKWSNLTIYKSIYNIFQPGWWNKTHQLGNQRGNSMILPERLKAWAWRSGREKKKRSPCGSWRGRLFCYQSSINYPLEVQHSPWKMMVGRLFSYWEGNFSGAMLNFGRVTGGFKYMFHVYPLFGGNDPIWRAYFSDGDNQAPTSQELPFKKDRHRLT